MNNAVELALENRWPAALSLFQIARQLNPESPSVTRAIETVSEVLELQQKIESYISERKPEKAVATARQLDRFIESISPVTFPE